ncbi:MAG: hypothetical protein AB7E81_10720 [Hyphomicrobiaceae bacterium]
MPTKRDDCSRITGIRKLKGDAAMKRSMFIAIAIGATLTLGACANDTLLGLSASEPTAALPAKPSVDPACPALASRIDQLRRDGVAERVESASKGKGTSVKVKRASLAQMTELDKANAEFQSKCSTVPRAASMPAPKSVASAKQAGDDKADAVIARAQAASASESSSKP